MYPGSQRRKSGQRFTVFSISVFLLGGFCATSSHPATGAPRTKPHTTQKNSASWDHLVCVVSRNDGVACHHAENGYLSDPGEACRSVAEPRTIYASRDRKHLYLGGTFEKNNDLCGVSAFRVTKDGTLNETGFWFTYNAPSLSFFEPRGRREMYISTLLSLLRYRSSAMTDLRREPTVAVPPGTLKQRDLRAVIALYAPAHSGKLALKRSGVKSGEMADFDAAVSPYGALRTLLPRKAGITLEDGVRYPSGNAKRHRQ